MISTLFWESTKRCNFRCAYCYSNAGAAVPDECQAPDVIRVLRTFKAQGGRRLVISGGEPTLYQGLEAALASARSLDLITVLCTNGSRHDPAWMDRVAPLVTQFVVSVDGPPAYTNSIRKAPGAFACAEALIRSCQRIGAKIAVQFNVSDQTWPYLAWFREFVREHQVTSVKLAHISNWGNAAENGLGLSTERQLLLVDEANHWGRETAFRLIPSTNLLTAEVFRRFYTDLDSALAPWLLSDGSLVPFYTGHPERWTVGRASDPQSGFADMIAAPGVRALLRRAYDIACTLPVVSLSDVVYLAEAQPAASEKRAEVVT